LPQGAEHVKKMLVGGILSVTVDDLERFVVLYGVIGICHWLLRRPLLAAAENAATGGTASLFWDLVFYLSFGLVVTSSVGVAGVLLVFCFLIVPALVGSMFTTRIGVALMLGWIAGTLASVIGIFGSFLFDAPTGALTVMTFAVVLVAAAALRAFVTAPTAERVRNRRIGLHAGGLVLALVLGLSGAWIVIAPAGDHPILAAIEMAMGPERFMTARERADYLDAAASERGEQDQIDQLYGSERQSRWQGERLTADEVRHIGVMQQSLTEMRRGERFVMDYLRTRARERERWSIGLPLAALGLAGTALLAWRMRRAARADAPQ
jgi:zinc/manganese transport system permease protein